jgi:hypothetical protein
MALLRIMMIDSGTGRPKIGAKSFQLGVRPFDGNPYFDVSAVSGTDLVDPATAQGLSCTTMPIEKFVLVAEPHLKRNSKRRIWEIESDQLPASVVAVHRPTEDDPDHWQIEPVFTMTLQEFQALLASTEDNWNLVQCPNGDKT